jgi:hypothetical protein
MHAGKPVAGRPDPLIWDAPLTYHLPMLLIWFPFEATILYQLGASIASVPLLPVLYWRTLQSCLRQHG